MELCAGGLSFSLQGPGADLQGGLSRAKAESPSAASAATATAFCFRLRGKQTTASLQSRAKLAANWHTITAENTVSLSTRLC